MLKDYLVVGFGLAGLAFTSLLDRKGKSFQVIDNNPDFITRVIGGMYNPIILKRFTPAWKAHEMWLKSIPTYHYFEKKFNKSYFQPFKVYRILKSIEEQNNWVVASDKVVMNQYMIPELIHEEIEGIHAPFGFGELINVGKIDGEILLHDYKEFLKKNNLLREETFDYNFLKINENYLEYKGEFYRKIIFSEGSQISNNPFFNYLPMKVSKGEMLLVKVPDLKMENAIKSSCFMIPLGNQLFIVGSTYHWDDTSFELTEIGRNELEKKLQSFLKLPYQIVDYKTGIRPTVLDRRPLLGKHPKYQNLAVFNGLGTRGIIYAPALAEILYEHLENATNLDTEMDIDRFKHLLDSKHLVQ